MKPLPPPPLPPRPSLLHTLAVVARSTLAILLTLVVAPITAPAFLQLPSCLATRLLERVSIICLRLIASVAAVDCTLHPRLQPEPPAHAAAHAAFLRLPLVRYWASPLPHARLVRTFDQPGRWMSDAELLRLHAVLRRVAIDSIGALPTHRLFPAGHAPCPRHLRDVFANRVVSVVLDAHGPLGFTAMVYLPCPGARVVVHLGLTMLAARARGRRLQTSLFTKCLVLPLLNLGRMGYVVTNCAASPAGIGAVCDYFLDAWPRYDGAGACNDMHVRVARHVLANFRHEFGCSRLATFDARRFVVLGSNRPDGGGTVEFRRDDGSAVSRHRDQRCNDFVAREIDFSAGDEMFQVARLHVVGTAVRYLALAWAKLRAQRRVAG